MAAMASILEYGSVSATMDVYSDFENYVSGIYHHVIGKNLGGHAVRVVGWGEENGTKYWKVANSWNSYWGENGYFRILRGSDECDIEDNMMSSWNLGKWSGPGL
jgi:cathepsin B